MTDLDAPRYRILKIDLNHPERANWKEIVPQAADAIQDFSVVGNRLYVNYLHNVVTHISIFSLEGKALGEVQMPGNGSAGISGNYGEDEGVLTFSSYTEPFTSYRFFSS